jgi:hypothetical protein
MWYSARAELGMDRGCFLRTSPRELEGLLGAVSEREKRHFVPAALICSVIANVNRDPDQRDEPYTVDDFLPGADGPKTKEEEMIEWLQHLERVESGEEEEEFDEEAMKNFRQKMQRTFKNLRSQGPVQTGSAIGPSGKSVPVNAISGETPQRGVR